MYQYKAILKSNKELVIAEGHTVKDVEHQILSWRRKQKNGQHTQANEIVQIFHVQRDQLHGRPKQELIKVDLPSKK